MPATPNPSHALEFVNLLTSGLANSDCLFLVELDKKKRFVSQKLLPPKDLTAFLSGVTLAPGHHYYITCNTFQKGGHRSTPYLQSLNAIVVDIDCHDSAISSAWRDFRIDYLSHLLKHDIADGEIPLPNIIVRSGRGLQVWWLLHRTEATESTIQQWKGAVASLANTLTHTIKHISDNGDDMYTLKGLSVDSAASTQPNGDFRLPGSINPNTKALVRAEIVTSERYDLFAFECAEVASRPGKAKKGGCTTPPKGIPPWSELMLQKTEDLRGMRNAPPGMEMRDHFCFVYLSLLKNLPISEAEIKRRIHAFNQGFKVPMTPAEMKSSLTTAWKEHYHLSTDTIMRYLEVDDAENLALGFQKPQAHNPGAIAKQQRQDRNAEIARLYMQGKTAKDIAAQLGVSRKTVQKEIKRQELPSPSERIISLHQQNLSNADIAAQIPCSLRTVQNTLKKWRDAKKGTSFNDICGRGPCPQGSPSRNIELSPALELLRQELYSRYGASLSEEDFAPHFSTAMQRLYATPTIDDVKAEFALPILPGQDKMYKNLLGL